MAIALRSAFSTLLTCAILGIAAAPAVADDRGDTLSLPGVPPITMPPGTRVFGPDDGLNREPGGDLYHEYGTVTPGGGADRGNGKHSRGPVSGQHAGGRLGTESFGGYGGLGGTVIGPGGVVPRRPAEAHRTGPAPKKALTPEERQAAIRKALAPKPPLAVAKRATLDELYAKLAASTDEDEAKGYASLIEAIWARSGSDTATLLMSRAEKAVSKKDYKAALDVLDRLVVLQPDWPEAWNQRASVRYLAGDLDGAMADVDRVLKLEPRHFSALAGMAMILQRTGFDKRALQIYRRDLAVYPLQPDVQKVVDSLALKVEGQGI